MNIYRNISDIITVQNSCKDIIQELYTYDSRPYDDIEQTHKSTKLNEAILYEIIEYDDYDNELSLSVDTEDYYKNRLGQQDETNISFISTKLDKLRTLLKTYNIRTKNNENLEKNTKQIYKLLNQIPSLLRYNLKTISSNSVFAFKNEPNFDIKMINLKTCQNEISKLTKASNEVDNYIKSQRSFFKSIKNKKINSVILKLKRNSLDLESSFRILYEDIKNFINQSIKDGEFIKKLKKLQELKNDGYLFKNTNIEELLNKKVNISLSIKEKKILRDDRVYDVIDEIQNIIKYRNLTIENTKEDVEIKYDINNSTTTTRIIYNYPKLNKEFLLQKKDLINFLKSKNIEKIRLLGVFVRMIKNFSSQYNMLDIDYIKIENRIYKKVLVK